MQKPYYNKAQSEYSVPYYYKDNVHYVLWNVQSLSFVLLYVRIFAMLQTKENIRQQNVLVCTCAFDHWNKHNINTSTKKKIYSETLLRFIFSLHVLQRWTKRYQYQKVSRFLHENAHGCCETMSQISRNWWINCTALIENLWVNNLSEGYGLKF